MDADLLSRLEGIFREALPSYPSLGEIHRKRMAWLMSLTPDQIFTDEEKSQDDESSR
jgi:hypothetical protein